MDRSAMILLQITLCLTVLVVETYSRISWTREILHRTKRQAECKPDEFKCTSGECIDIVSVCDGTKKCADGSDDTELTCKQLNITDSPSPPEGGCRLPQPPDFGAYTSPDCQTGEKTAACRQVTGTPVPQNWLLSFKCNEGYSHKESQDANIYVICVDGKWSPKIPVCRIMCSPLASLSLDTRCVNKGVEVDCTKPMLPGTRATVQCKSSYTTTSPYPYIEIFCTDKGQWSGELLHCEPACGRRNWKGVNTPLIEYGSAAKHGEFPWHVGVYWWRYSSDQWDLGCGGSLISRHIVVTAARCVSSWKRSPEEIKVGLGKYYREWYHDEPYAVKADVREILFPPGYSGEATLDIALLDLTRSVQLHAGIMPVCVDWKREFTIPPGALGTLAGWGWTEHSKLSDVLLSVDLPYVDRSQCINHVPERYQRWITSDTFCAGYFNGTGTGQYAQWKDFGGGLTFVQDDLYYVYGIASNRVPYGNVWTANNRITAFTNITNEEILNWLISSKNEFDKELDEEYPEKCPEWKFKCAYGACIGVNKTCNGQADCADGSDEADCPIATTTTRLPPPSTTSPSPNLPTQPPGPPIYGGGGLGATSSHAFPGTPIPVSFRCKETEFKCTSGQCIDKLSLCDGRVDCPDGSDETRYQCASVSIVQILTQTISFSCPKSKFPCSYGACIDANKQCDGQSDCADGSDEEVSACPGRTKTSVLALAAPTHIVRTSVPASATPTHILRTNDVQRKLVV